MLAPFCVVYYPLSAPIAWYKLCLIDLKSNYERPQNYESQITGTTLKIHLLKNSFYRSTASKVNHQNLPARDF